MNQGIKLYKTYEVKKISDCHQSIGPKTLTPNSRLDRWSGVHNAISDCLQSSFITSKGMSILFCIYIIEFEVSTPINKSFNSYI